MAEQPTAGYFALLAAGLSDMAPKEGADLFEATRGSAQAKGQQYGTFLAALIAPPPAAPAQPTRVAAGPRPTTPAAGQPPTGMPHFPTAAELKAMEEADRRAAMAATSRE